MNIKTGEVLALASYPDYEPELFVSGISQSKLDEYNKIKTAITGQFQEPMHQDLYLNGSCNSSFRRKDNNNSNYNQ